MEQNKGKMKVLQGQTLFDIAIQSCGSTEAAFELAVLNSLSLTDDIETGFELSLPDVIDQDIATYFQNKNIKPATLLTVQAEEISSVVDTVIRTTAVKSNMISVIQGQTLFDIAIQEFGSIEAAFDLAIINNLSVTDVLVPGTLLAKISVVNKKVASYYADKALTPATGLVSSPDRTRIFNNIFSNIFG